MAGTPSNLISSASRPIRLRRRADLIVGRQQYQGQAFWVIKDPLALKYFRFHDEEYALLQMLNGQMSLEQIRRRFERRFAPQKLSLEELTTFIGSLHRSGLVVADSPGQAKPLLDRRRETTRRERLSKVTNILSVRFQGFDPDRLLTWLDQRIGWLFSKPMTIVGLLIALAAALLVTVQFDAFRGRLPAFGEFFALQNWFALAVTLGLTKVLHEFGHGLVCKRFRGECHEMGVMFLVLTPCLYVNVSDSWMLPNRWHRAAIGAAGMYVEIVLASLATFVWWFSEPGLLNYLCLNVMFVSSVSTVLFNANPLLRYDGYYILSDIVEIPNLRSKSSAVLQRTLGRWCLGIDPTPDPFLPQRNQALFAMYTIAAAAYRWVICFSILWFLHSVFKPYGLQVVGQLLAALSLWGLVVMPLWQLAQFFHVPGRVEKVNTKRAAISGAGLIACLIAVMFLPLPYYVECPFVVQPRDAASVYVNVPGHLQAAHVQSGKPIRQGQPIATLSSIDVQIALADAQGQREQLITRVDDLQRRQFNDATAAMEVAEAEESLLAIEQQLEQRQRDLDALTVTAPANGQIIPPPRRPVRTAEDELPTWHGTPLEPRNMGAALDAGVLLCFVGNPRELEAVIDIDQSDVDFVGPKQDVKLKFDALPGETIHTRIAHLAQLKREGERDDAKRSSHYGEALTTKYQASAEVNDEAGLLVPGASGMARIRAGNQTLAQRAWRYFSQTFRFNS